MKSNNAQTGFSACIQRVNISAKISSLALLAGLAACTTQSVSGLNTATTMTQEHQEPQTYQAHQDQQADSIDTETGYPLVLSIDFNDPESFQKIRCTDPKVWRQGQDEGRHTLELLGGSRTYKPRYRSPYSIAIIDGQTYGDFVMEVEVKNLARRSPFRDFSIMLGFQDPDHFYYCHVGDQADSDAHHQIHLVNAGPRTAITEKRTTGYDWGDQDTYRTMRIVRHIDSGLIQAFMLDEPDRPVLEAHDLTFTRGFVGMGSFDDMGHVRKIRIYSPDAQEEKSTAYQPMNLPAQ